MSAPPRDGRYVPASPDKRLSIVVLDAIEKGAETSAEVSDDTGLSIPTASAYLTRLCQDGAIVARGWFYPGHKDKRARMIRYAPARET